MNSKSKHREIAGSPTKIDSLAKRIRLNLKQEEHLIELSQHADFDVEKAAKNYGVSKSCVYGILKKKDDILKFSNSFNLEVLLTVHSAMPEIEKILFAGKIIGYLCTIKLRYLFSL